jgi:hypothetical protein
MSRCVGGGGSGERPKTATILQYLNRALRALAAKKREGEIEAE